MSAVPIRAEDIHPSLWRASQLARGRGHVVETGYPALSAEIPGGGWPVGALVDLLVQQAGVGEMRLLRPALGSLGARPIALVQPPHIPNGLGLGYIGLELGGLLRVSAPKTADALWSAEQILRAGSCGALIFWAQHVQASSLRRPHLAAHSSGEAIPATAIEIALGEPTWRETHLVRLLNERLHRAELAAPVIALRLDVSRVQAAAPATDSLFLDPGGSVEDHARPLELLVARLLVACLWSRWSNGKDPDLLSFAAITVDPPPEVAAAGHDRCIVPIKPENVDAWLNPDASDLAAQYAILDDRDRPYYEHRLAA